MIHAKRFYLKIRKAKTNWGCPCCVPVVLINDKVNTGKKKEKEFFTKLIREQLTDK